MKFNPDIARRILLAMEAHDNDELPFRTHLIPDLDDATYYFHNRMLADAGLISVYELRKFGSVNYFWPRELKYAGVQFLQMFQNETLWQRTKSEAAAKGVGVALETLTQIGTNLITKVISSQVPT